jgi:hypothetical protein
MKQILTYSLLLLEAPCAGMTPNRKALKTINKV